ncbi:MAG: hypothetical protein KatS3mg102_1169 [Planctomycetota bacterium]|nr:MAG: hypothetical protein KatS3mg102_1169 [Planctomycetota bacterium]
MEHAEQPVSPSAAAEQLFESILEVLRAPLAAAEVPLPPPGEAGMAVSGAYLGTRPLYEGERGPAAALAALPRHGVPVEELAQLLLEAEQAELPEAEQLRQAARQALALAQAGEHQAALARLAAVPLRPVLCLPEAIRPLASRALAAVRLEAAARAGLEGDLAAAIDHVAAAMGLQQRDPTLPELQLRLAELVLQRQGAGAPALPQAVASAEMRLDDAPLPAEAYARLSALHLARGEPPAAAARALRVGAKLAGEDRELQRALAGTAIARAPQDAWSHRLLGLAAYLDGRLEEAIAHLERAQAGGQRVAGLLGAAYVRAGELERGRALLEPLLAEGRAGSEAALALAEALFERGERQALGPLLALAAQVGEPYRSRGAVLQALMALERGERLEAHRLLFEAPDACEPLAVRAFAALGRAHRQAGDLARAEQAEQEAQSMAALPEVRQRYAFITNPLGQPLLIASDAGGQLYAGVHRRTGARVLVRLRRLAPGERAEAVAPLGGTASPFVLRPLARQAALERVHTVLPDPAARSLAAVLAGGEGAGARARLAAVRRPLLVGLAAAVADLDARGAGGLWLVPERVLVTRDGAPRLLPHDPRDVPLGPAGAEPSFALAPELHQGQPPGPASDVYAVAAIARRLIGEVRVSRELQEVLAAALQPEPAARPPAARLLLAMLRGLG